MGGIGCSADEETEGKKGHRVSETPCPWQQTHSLSPALPAQQSPLLQALLSAAKARAQRGRWACWPAKGQGESRSAPLLLHFEIREVSRRCSRSHGRRWQPLPACTPSHRKPNYSQWEAQIPQKTEQFRTPRRWRWEPQWSPSKCTC